MLQANYTELMQAANEINQAASDYLSEVKSLYEIVDNLTNVWSGKDNKNFINTVNEYKTDIMALGDIVNNYATFLTKVKESLEETQSGVADAAGRL